MESIQSFDAFILLLSLFFECETKNNFQLYPTHAFLNLSQNH